ncbi:MAG: hypothetical protein ACREDQ_11005 [Limisphaerales bacterium]
MKNPILEYLRLVRTIERAKRDGRTGELLKAAKENAEIQRIMMQPRRYEVINGAGEIGWGTFMLCMALSSYATVVLPNSPWRNRISLTFLLCGCVVMPLCLWASKKFVIQPRIGYVAFRPDKSRWIGMAGGMIVAAGFSIGLIFLLRSEMFPTAQSTAHHIGATNPGTPSLAGKLIQIGLGPMNALLYLMMNAVSIKEHRWKWPALILIAVAPLGISFSAPGNFIEVSRPVNLFLGLVWFTSGTVTLFWFLRHHQPPAPEAE